PIFPLFTAAVPAPQADTHPKQQEKLSTALMENATLVECHHGEGNRCSDGGAPPEQHACDRIEHDSRCQAVQGCSDAEGDNAGTQSSLDGREKDEDERSFLIINVTIRNAPTENFLAEMRVFSFVPDKGDRAERPAHEKGNQQNQAKSQDFGPRT